MFFTDFYTTLIFAKHQKNCQKDSNYLSIPLLPTSERQLLVEIVFIRQLAKLDRVVARADIIEGFVAGKVGRTSVG